MQINNPVQMNDWKIGKNLKIVLAIQFAMWGTIGLDAIGLQIPILRQIIGFIYLTFVPGILIIRILKLHKLGNIETILYTVGLSIATLMFTGLFMNLVYPFFGISRPISLVSLVITISVVVLVLCVLCYVRDKDFFNPSFIVVSDVLSPPILFLCLVPFLAILGTYLANCHDNNILLLFIIIIIVIIAVLIAFDKFIPKSLYPLAVFVIAISLLYHNSLISMYLWGFDIHTEYWYSNLVIVNGLWDSTVVSNVNAMLSIVMLAPIYSDISGMSLTWVYKIIYPLIFSLIPLGLYRIFQKQTTDKIAFFSCFFFVSIFTFYTEMLALARQQISELFLVLLVMLLIDKDMNKLNKSALFITFGISLTVSHYGTCYVYLFSLIAVWLLLALTKNQDMPESRDYPHSNFGRKREKLAGNPFFPNAKDRTTLSSTFVLLFVVVTLTWYMYVSSSSAFTAIVRIGDHIASSLITDFLNPTAAQGLYFIQRTEISPLYTVHKYLHVFTQLIVFVGFIALMLSKKWMKFERDYIAFSLISLVICLAGIAVPYFASSLNAARLYHITLIFLAPFFVIGWITVFKKIRGRVVRASWTAQDVESSLKVLSVFLVIFLLFNTGLVYEVTKDKPSSISLNSTFDFPRFNEQEVSAGEWLRDEKTGYSGVYSDVYRGLLLSEMFKEHCSFSGDSEDNEITTWMLPNAYIFLGHENVKNNKIMLVTPDGRVPVTLQNLTFYKTVLDMDKVYNNGDAEVYYR